MKTMRAFGIALLPLIIIAAALALYFLYYKRSINRSLNDPDRSDRRRFISPSEMTLAVIAIFLLISNSSNRATISQLTQQVNNLTYRINELSSQIDELNRDKTHEFDYYLQVSSISKDESGRYIADVTLTVEPAITTDSTTATLYLDDRTYILSRKEKGLFTTDFQIPTASHPQSCYLIIDFDDGGIREDLYLEPEKLYDSLMPAMQISGSSEISLSKLNLDVSIGYHYPELQNAGFTDHVLKIVDDGKTIYEEKLVPNKDSDSIAIKTSKVISSEKDVQVFIESTDSKGWKYYTYFLNGSLDYVRRIVDENGVTVISY